MRGHVSGVVGSVLAALAAAALLACVGGPAPVPPERVIGEAKPYLIGVPDVLSIRVWKQAELSIDVQVRADGKITVPLVDDVQAEGLTPEELKAVITETLAEYITAPDVTVIVKEMLSNTVAVMGGVTRAGLVPLQRNTRVLDVIAQSGGFSPFAKKSRVRILRNTEAGQVAYRFDYDRFIDGKAPGTNLLLEPGDTIVVPD